MTPRTNPLDIHYPDASNRFRGPDGRDYVWAEVHGQWLLADAQQDPASYNALLGYNTACTAECGCSKGEGD